MAASELRPKTRLTRALYAPVVLFAPPIAGWFFVVAWVGYFTHPPLPWFAPRPPWYLSMVTLVGFIIPGVLAWWRVGRRMPLIPAARLTERPMVARVVAFFSGSAIVLAIFIVWVMADALAKAADDIGGPLGFFCMIMAMAAAVALLVGELALVGPGDSARSPDAAV
jgi:hypothetical protein